MGRNTGQAYVEGGESARAVLSHAYLPPPVLGLIKTEDMAGRGSGGFSKKNR